MAATTSHTQDGAVKTELLGNGFRRHTLADGRVFEENGPMFTLTYQSFMPNSKYSRNIAIFGLNPEDKCLFDAWCYVNNTLRTYAFGKVISLTELRTGKILTGNELRKLMNGEVRTLPK